MRANTDYAIVVPVTIFAGRMRVNVENDAGKIYASQVIEPLEHTSATDQPEESLRLHFVAVSDDQIRVVWANEASTTPHSWARVGPVGLYDLGQARFVWTRYPRAVIHLVQKAFVTLVFQLLAVAGILIMIIRLRRGWLLILFIVPVYFMTVQSAFHTEYRYVIAVTYFVFAFAGVAIGCGSDYIINRLTSMRMKSEPSA